VVSQQTRDHFTLSFLWSFVAYSPGSPSSKTLAKRRPHRSVGLRSHCPSISRRRSRPASFSPCPFLDQGHPATVGRPPLQESVFFLLTRLGLGVTLGRGSLGSLGSRAAAPTSWTARHFGLPIGLRGLGLHWTGWPPDLKAVRGNAPSLRPLRRSRRSAVRHRLERATTNIGLSRAHPSKLAVAAPSVVTETGTVQLGDRRAIAQEVVGGGWVDGTAAGAYFGVYASQSATARRS